MNAKRIYRLYAEEDLQIRNKWSNRMVSAKIQQERRPPAALNEVWAMEFLSEQLFDGCKIKVLTFVDAYSKLSPAIDVRAGYTGADIVSTMRRVCSEYGVPKTIRFENGREFISRDLDLWAYANGVTMDFSCQGKPTDNSFVVAFNGKLCAECIDQD